MRHPLDFTRWPWRAAIVAWLLLLPGWASAQGRPSLVDLDAKLGQVVNGLCNGDPATCGTTPLTPLAGHIDFGLFQADFFALYFTMTQAGGGDISEVSVTLDAAAITALIMEHLQNGSTFSNVLVEVPNPSGPGYERILAFTNAVLVSIQISSDGSRVDLGFDVHSVTYSWLGASSSWDETTSIGSGCLVPAGEQHVALSGNDPSLLGPGEVEASFGLSVSPISGLSFLYTRPPTATSACLLNTVGSGASLVADFHRLSPLSGTFSTQLREETIEISASTIAFHTLRIEGDSLSESITLNAPGGKITSREFSPVDGSLVTFTETLFGP